MNISCYRSPVAWVVTSEIFPLSVRGKPQETKKERERERERGREGEREGGRERGREGERERERASVLLMS